jgi:hypothetical protein
MGSFIRVHQRHSTDNHAYHILIQRVRIKHKFTDKQKQHVIQSYEHTNQPVPALLVRNYFPGVFLFLPKQIIG